MHNGNDINLLNITDPHKITFLFIVLNSLKKIPTRFKLKDFTHVIADEAGHAESHFFSATMVGIVSDAHIITSAIVRTSEQVLLLQDMLEATDVEFYLNIKSDVVHDKDICSIRYFYEMLFQKE